MPWAQIFVLLLLIAINGFLVMAELAIVSSRRARLQIYAHEKRPGAASALKLLEDPARFLSSVQIGITIVAILAGAYGEGAISPGLADALRGISLTSAYAQTIASTVVVLAISYISLVAGELAPKRLALAKPEKLACFVAPAMTVIAYVSAPLAALLRKSSDHLVGLFVKKEDVESEVTEEEVKTLIAEGTEAGVFKKAEQEMLEGVFRVADLSVRSIMVPRPDIVWLDIEQPAERVLEEISQTGHSRYPVSRGDVDEIVGVVQAKVLFEQMHKTGTIDLEAAVKAPLYVHESANVLKLLSMFKTSLGHLAVVLDEHGTVQGIVTPTDILTGIAGDLPEEEADRESGAVQREDGSWLLDAQMPVFEVERILDVSGLVAPDAEYTTLAGFVLSRLGHIPRTGEIVKWNDWRFEVVDLDGRRIDKILASQHERAEV